jgi:UDP-glucose 4-epimerase
VTGRSLPARREVETLVVGSHGLLGSAVVRELRREDRTVRRVDVPWTDHAAAVDVLVAAAADLLATGAPWRLLWCAGSGVVGSTEADLDAELRTLTGFLLRLGPLVGDRADRGRFFLASSAGGVYAGSSSPPFTEDTVPAAISPYGVAKLSAEALVDDFARRTGVPTFVGRIANLYGPGQDTSKAQGLISQLCRAHLERRPSSIYVSLDTSRDYLYVDDAAKMVVAGVERVGAETPGAVHTKILASQRGTTVAMILGELRRITKRTPRVVLGTSRLARYQTRDLRFRSRVWPDLDRLVTTSLPAGMFSTMEAAGLESRAPSPRGVV